MYFEFIVFFKTAFIKSFIFCNLFFLLENERLKSYVRKKPRKKNPKRRRNTSQDQEVVMAVVARYEDLCII